MKTAMARAKQAAIRPAPIAVSTAVRGAARVGTTYLLDVNVLIALAWPQHVHHKITHAWFEQVGSKRWASCPLTQLAFVRISSNPKIIADAVNPRAALQALTQMTELPGHQFWSDDIALNGLATFAQQAFSGHRQVTDAYLLELARHHHGKLATLDRGVGDLVIKAEVGELISFVE